MEEKKKKRRKTRENGRKEIKEKREAESKQKI